MNSFQKQRVEAGLCMWCAAPLSEHSPRLCRACLAKRTVYQQKYYYRAKERKGIHGKPRGRPRTWLFSVSSVENGEEVFRGTAAEVAERFSCKPSAVYANADVYARFRKKYILKKVSAEVV